MHDPPTSITGLIHAWSEGRDGASDALAEQVYAELHRIASTHLQNERNAGLDATELVHEAWLKLGEGHGAFPTRKHFFAFAALQMRRLLIDMARAASAAMRRGEPVTLSLRLVDPAPQPADIATLAEALDQLDRMDTRKSQAFALVELAGFDTRQTAELLDVSSATIERDLRFARVWLAARMA
ncbi:ECF-type sigma factor [Xanthomonadaceae bacterium JHOS43]|nr:ECF-type sigma factor [Xanthomonadaceae bacterium JHOS43]MCX7562775.1 ECF-type sigma factor [Xanthomonadaceae bacterium XH05]